MKFSFCIAILFAFVLNSCHQAHTTNNELSDTLKHINLKYGFKLKIGKGEDFGNFKTYSYLEVWHNNAKLFTDTSKEYDFGEKQYPILNQLKPNVFELLVEFNDRPSKNKVTFLRIENDKIVKNDTLLTFNNKTENINGIIEYSGILDGGEGWDENGISYAQYNPTLYYKFTPDGFKLDSALTILKNKEKYGRFNGFKYDEKIGYPIDKNNKLDTVEKHVLRKRDN